MISNRVDVDHAPVGDLERRDDRKCQEGQLQERLVQGHAQRFRRRPQRLETVMHLLETPPGSSAPPREAPVPPAPRHPAPRRSRPRSPTAGSPPAPCRRNRTPTQAMLWWSWHTVEAMAPDLRPNPFTKPVAMLPFRPCRSTTAMRTRSRAGSGRLSPSCTGMCSRRCSVMILPSRMPITAVRRARWAGGRKLCGGDDGACIRNAGPPAG